MRALLAALLLAACGSSSKPATEPAPMPASQEDAPASDDCERRIRAEMDISITASQRYSSAILERATKWAPDNCEAARLDLLALAPEADAFYAEMMRFMEWAGTLTPECRDRVVPIGEAHPKAQEIEATIPKLKQHVDPTLDACKDHPGFADAQARGLKVMKRKRP